MFVLKLVTSLFLASLGFGSNHSPPGVAASAAVQPAVVPAPSSSATAAPQQPHSAPGHNNNAHHKDMTVKDLRKVFQVHSHADGMSFPASVLPLSLFTQRNKRPKS